MIAQSRVVDRLPGPLRRRWVPLALAAVVLLALPQVIQQSYMLDILVSIALYTALALSYDLTVGYVGSLSLAHPAFFGAGAYTAALLATKAHTPILVNLVASAVIAAVLALVIGIQSFRLSEYSFAIGTLGFATVAQVVAQNWIDVTRGPLCVTSVPRPSIFVQITTLPGIYYLFAAFAVLVLAFNDRLIRSRIGRSFKAIRENEVMARAVGINPLKYKMVAFILGAALAGCVGTLYAHYYGIVCPTEVGLNWTLTLLVILFVGGSGSLLGVVLGAIVVTVLPEVFRVTDVTSRLIAYGVALLLIINFLPNGLSGLFQRRLKT